jgi:hypothetical protein
MASRNRLEKYRVLMRAFDGAQPAGPYYQRRPDCASRRLTARLLLHPGAVLALIGGIGSGKSSELQAAVAALAKRTDWYPVYVDVSLKHDLTELKAGTVLAAIGLSLSDGIGEATDPAVKKAIQSFKRWGHGYTAYDSAEPDFDDGSYWVKGVLTPPERPFYGDVKEMLGALSTLLQARAGNATEFAIFIDSLDRLIDPRLFVTAVDQDLRALRSVAAVVTTAPLQVMFGRERTVLDQFDDFVHQASVDPTTVDGRTFLASVILARGGDLMDENVAGRVARLSGGAMRDLIQLARSSAEAAYLAGADSVEADHVDRAAQAFGKKLLFGLTEDELTRLRVLALTGSFLSVSDDDRSLLFSRRVLEYEDASTNRYAVHPTIRKLLV